MRGAAKSAGWCVLIMMLAGVEIATVMDLVMNDASFLRSAEARFMQPAHKPAGNGGIERA